MSFFDQPYYALTKAHMCRMGIWPEQSKYVQIIRQLTIFAISLTFAGPVLIRLYAAWRDILADSVNILLIGSVIYLIAFTNILYYDDMKLTFSRIEEHWEILKHTPAVIILNTYAERGRYITVIYSIYAYLAMSLYFAVCLSPVILDFVDPLNETRRKIYLIETEYGVDPDKYYWFILAHSYIASTVCVSMIVAIITMHILWAVHACALFEVVGFADLIESCCYIPIGLALGVTVIIAVISGVKALMNWQNPGMLIQHATLIFGAVLHLYLASIPGQELINHSEKIRTIAYNLNWQNISVNAQKLLILVLVRSNKLCYFTAGKVCVQSMETFGSAIRTAVSYFTVFAQMI